MTTKSVEFEGTLTFLHISRKVKIWMQRATVGSGVGSGSKIDAEKKRLFCLM